QTVQAGQPASFTVASAGTPPLSHQWYLGADSIPGAVTATCAIQSVSPADTGFYRCRVRNVCGSAFSNPAHLGIATPPSCENRMRNPGFESGTTDWSFYTNGTAAFTSAGPGYEGSQAGRVGISAPGTNVQLYQYNIPLTAGRTYRLRFAGTCNTGHDLAVSLQKHVSPYTNYGLNNVVFNLTDAWQVFQTQFTASGFAGSVGDGRIRFVLQAYDAAGDVYRLDAVELCEVTLARPDGGQDPVPSAFRLLQNYPNPFNPLTTIAYDLPATVHVSLRVYDLLGREVAVVVDEVQPAGRIMVEFDAEALASGIYFYRLTAGEFAAMQRLVVLK
ncbi:MAG: carbohydrate binding domain-containing protein, partial [Bacteroidota bacterium]